MAEAEVAQPPTVTEDIPKDESQVANNVSPVTETPKDSMVNGEEEPKVEGVSNDTTAAENEVVENGEKEENKKEDTPAETGSPNKAKKDKKPSKIANFLRKFSCTSGEPDENINPKSKPIEKNNSDSKPKVNGEEKKKKDKKKNNEKKEDEVASGEEKEAEDKDNVVSNDEVKVVITEAEEVKVNGEVNGEEVAETAEVKETPAAVNGEVSEKVEEAPAVNGVCDDNEEVKIIEEVVIVPKMEGLNIENKGEPEGSAVVEEPVIEHREPPSEAPPPIPEGEAAAAVTETSTEKAAPTEGDVPAEENK